MASSARVAFRASRQISPITAPPASASGTTPLRMFRDPGAIVIRIGIWIAPIHARSRCVARCEREEAADRGERQKDAERFVDDPGVEDVGSPHQLSPTAEHPTALVVVDVRRVRQQQRRERRAGPDGVADVEEAAEERHDERAAQRGTSGRASAPAR